MKGKLTPAVVEAWASLVRTERTLLDKVEEDLKRARLPPLDWYHVLYEIDRSPKGMMRQTGVQDRTQLAQYNVCRLVDRLEREGLIGRAPSRADRRKVELRLSPKGRLVLAKLAGMHRAELERIGPVLRQLIADVFRDDTMAATPERKTR